MKVYFNLTIFVYIYPCTYGYGRLFKEKLLLRRKKIKFC